MALSLAAVVPHSPLLVERIGGERTASLAPTLDALRSLAAELAQARTETIVIVGDHGSLQPDRLTLCMPPSLHLQLRKFGDVSTDMRWRPDVAFGNALREYGETNLPLCTVAPGDLGYAVGVPLMFLTQHVPSIRVVCLGPALLPIEDHSSLGIAVRHIAELSASRVALIVAGDIPEGSEAFSAATQRALAGSPGDLLDSSRWTDSPQALAWRSMATLLGAMGEGSWTPEVLAEQRVFETGLLTAVLRP
jgi:aromatic ring-opening dioxygenase LigB subunit